VEGAGRRATAATALPGVKLPAKPRVFLIDQPGAVQANILVGQLVPSSTDAGAIDFDIANAVLGGEFSSRLNMNLRESKHWAYGSYSGTPSDASGQRPWIASAAVQIDKTADSMKELDREIRDYATGKVPATARRAREDPVDRGARPAGQLRDRRRRPRHHQRHRAVQPPRRLRRQARHGGVQALTPALLQDRRRRHQADGADLGRSSAICRRSSRAIRALKLGDVKVLDADGKVVR
jgi:zinc protease